MPADAGRTAAPLPGQRAKQRETVLILARDMSVQKRKKMRQECSKSKWILVRRLRCEVPLPRREIEDDAELGCFVHGSSPGDASKSQMRDRISGYASSVVNTLYSGRL